MIAANTLKLVVITPESIIMDRTVSSLQFPLEDGQVGILPGRAPMVGRLGFGPLTIEAAGKSESFFIDGGFCQIKGGVVSILTNHATGPDQITAEQARAHLDKAVRQMALGAEVAMRKTAEVDRARAMLRWRTDLDQR